LNEVPRVSCADLKGRMDEGERLVLIDTRPPDAYQAGHIPGAINIYYDPGADPAGRQLLLSALPVEKQLVPYCE
jgi:rhodanese-related sulfurtransferase